MLAAHHAGWEFFAWWVCHRHLVLEAFSASTTVAPVTLVLPLPAVETSDEPSLHATIHKLPRHIGVRQPSHSLLDFKTVSPHQKNQRGRGSFLPTHATNKNQVIARLERSSDFCCLLYLKQILFVWTSFWFSKEKTLGVLNSATQLDRVTNRNKWAFRLFWCNAYKMLWERYGLAILEIKVTTLPLIQFRK